MKSSHTPILHVFRNDLQNNKFKKHSVAQMKERKKTFPLLHCKFLSPPTEFFKKKFRYASYWSWLSPKICKNSPTRSGNIGAQSWKYGKSHSIPSGRILCEKALDISPFDRLTGYTCKKSNQNQLGRVLPFAFALTCCKIYLNIHHCNVLWHVHVSKLWHVYLYTVDCAHACSHKTFAASLTCPCFPFNIIHVK